MSYYFLASIKIHDEAEYNKYLAGSKQVFSKFKGKYLSVDTNPMLMEGSWNYSHQILIEFPTREDFDAWYFSDEYQEILQHRLKASESDSILIKGIQNEN